MWTASVSGGDGSGCIDGTYAYVWGPNELSCCALATGRKLWATNLPIESIDLAFAFAAIQSNIPATPPVNTYTDAFGGGAPPQKFYRVEVQP